MNDNILLEIIAKGEFPKLIRGNPDAFSQELASALRFDARQATGARKTDDVKDTKVYVDAFLSRPLTLNDVPVIGTDYAIEAVKALNPNALKVLQHYGLPLERADIRGKNLLHYAAKACCEGVNVERAKSVITFLCDQGVDINQIYHAYGGHTPLTTIFRHIKGSEEDIGFLDLMLDKTKEAGVELRDVQSENGRRLLDFAGECHERLTREGVSDAMAPSLLWHG